MSLDFSYHRVLACVTVGWLLFTNGTNQAAELPAKLRRPVAMVLSSDEKQLYVANRNAGSLSLVDVTNGTVTQEIVVGKQLSDLKRVPNSTHLVATDEATHELLILQPSTESGVATLQVVQRLPVSPYPVSIAIAANGQHCYVGSLWSRRLSVIRLPQGVGEQATVVAKLDLAIAPRCQLLIEPEQRLIVADSFSGKLVIIDTEKNALLGTREFPGHNVRGLGRSTDGKMLIVAHQMLNDYAHTLRNDVHWGLLMSNDLRWLKLDRVLSGEGDLYEGGHMHPLGHAGSATGDPAGLVVAANGMVIVTLGGVGEIATGMESDFGLQRLPVGTRPTNVVASADSKRAFVCNTFGDDVHVVDLMERETLQKISLGPQPEYSLRDLGELAFYDARQSHDGWMSCHSCHSDGHTNGQLNDNFSDASFGAAKRVLTLLGRADTAPFAWNGSNADMATQIRKSLVNTMQKNDEPDNKTIQALTAYVESLASPPSVQKLRGTDDVTAIARGQKVFAAQSCQTCHAPPTYTTPQTYDVGLKDKQGNDHFNPPSLRGVGQRAPYFHDNRAKTLDDVLLKHRHQLADDTTDAAIQDLLSFLRSL